MRSLALLLSAAAFAHARPSTLDRFPLDSPPPQLVLNPSIPSHDSALQTLTHAAHPRHRLRLRQPQGLCDDVEQFSGYIDTDRGHHAFFWAFESRNDPANDPVVLCWNNNATVIFLDQPIGVGFSYRDKHAPKIWTSEAAAEDVYAFLHIWFETFSDKFGNAPLHIAGESYAGRYIPVFADYILKHNAKASASGQRPIPLRSVLIGNGFTNPLVQYGSYIPAVCTDELGGPWVGESGCRKMKEAWPVCERLVEKCWANPTDTALCISAYRFCESSMTDPYAKTGRSMYNFHKYGEYDEDEWIAKWLNQPRVRHELGVDPDKHGRGPGRFEGCSDGVFSRFEDSGDDVKPSFQQVANILDAGVDVLLYVGALDMICNILGVQSWSLDPSFAWSNASSFRNETLKPWFASEEAARSGKGWAGAYRQSGGLAFAGVDGAGHFVPYDKPKEALALFNRWIWERKVGFS
ncbi:hypothetical protein JCM10207_003101 [Rhodosporidiobolus poonsookiae]